MPAFTRENAAALARKSTQSRLANAAAARAESERLRQENSRLSIALAAFEAAQAARPGENYTAERLEQVREQLHRVTGLLAKSTEALDVERYARALAALNTMEFALAGRPLPGSLRPTAAAARRTLDYRSTLTAPASPQPAPLAPSNPFRRAG